MSSLNKKTKKQKTNKTLVNTLWHLLGYVFTKLALGSQNRRDNFFETDEERLTQTVS
jgi:hypothetical protein